jgi:hypothetical protein
MHGEPELMRQVRSRLWLAMLRRRASFWLLALLPWLVLLALPRAAGAAMAGLVLWAVWLAVEIAVLRRRLTGRWTHWLDAAVPALEDSSALLADTAGRAPSPIAQLQRRRLLDRLLSVLGPDDYRRVARGGLPFLPLHLLPLFVSVVAVLAVWTVLHKPGVPAVATVQTTGPGGAPAAPDLVIRVTPPPYTGVAPFETTPRDISVPQYSEVSWCLKDAAKAAVAVEFGDGRTLQAGAACATWHAGESLFWRWHQANAQPGARYNVRVVADQAPQISILAPKELTQTLTAQAGGVELSVAARDDHAIVRASLHLTLARGSGENIRFSDREMPLPQSADPKLRNWSKRWSLAELGMEPGDDLYFFVRATDNDPEHPHTAQSPTYTLRLPGPDAEDLDASAQPTLVKPENLRSQRQVIIDTEQLVADLKAHPKMDAATLRERSESIATDEAHLRLRYGQFLGEESSLFGNEHHHDEHEGGHEHGGGAEHDMIAEFGHSHDQAENATLFDPATKAILRRALMAMWDAEKSLRAIAPNVALPPEYKALNAIKELQQADRIYLHRTAFVPPALKEEKRMSGDMTGALSYKREQDGPGDGVPAALRELVRALGSDAPLPALWSAQARELIAARLHNDEQKLAAQKAVQDVADGCVPCRAVLRAWLRGAIVDAPVLLQATPQTDSKFHQAWQAAQP